MSGSAPIQEPNTVSKLEVVSVQEKTGPPWTWFWSFAAISVFLDQVSKWAALNFLDPASPVPVLPGLFDLHLVFNPGAAFSLFQGARWMFIGVSGAAVVFLPWYLASLYRHGETHWVHPVGLGLVLGGAIGNALDRVFRPEGLVVDFFDAFWRDHHFPVFNIADSAITVGIALILVWSLFGQGAKSTDSEKRESEFTVAESAGED